MPGRATPARETAGLYEEIGKAIRRERTRQKRSQDELARAVHLSRTSITNLESGRQQVPLHTLYEIAFALGRDVQHFLPRAAPKSKTPAYGNEDIDRWADQLTRPTGRRRVTA